MGLIGRIGTTIDTTLVDYAQTIFDGVAGPMRTLLASVALIGLIFIAVNQITQFRAINYSVYLHWAFRYILIYTFATMWVNFAGIYNIFMQVPNDYASLLLKAVALHVSMNGSAIGTNMFDPGQIHDIYSSMDEFGHVIIWIAWDFLRDTTFSDIGMSLRNIFLGALILAIGGIFLAAGAIIILVGRVGFAVAISLAPLAIVMLMVDQTKHHFESWMRFTLGFAIIPLLTAALMALILYVAGEILRTSGYTHNDKDKIFYFIFIMIAALVLMFQLPTMASTLSSASVAAVGAGAAFAAKSMITRNAMSMFTQTRSAGRRVRDAAGAANGARKAGGSKQDIGKSLISAFRQSAATRAGRRDRRLEGRIKGGDGVTASASSRHSAAGGRGSGDSPSSSDSGKGQMTQEQQNLNRGPDG